MKDMKKTDEKDLTKVTGGTAIDINELKKNFGPEVEDAILHFVEGSNTNNPVANYPRPPRCE